jgi:hypothetical protein
VEGPNAVFQQRSLSNKSNAYWPLFLGELLRHRDLDDFKVSFYIFRSKDSTDIIRFLVLILE